VVGDAPDQFVHLGRLDDGDLFVGILKGKIVIDRQDLLG
jgi:hypothetical protein